MNELSSLDIFNIVTAIVLFILIVVDIVIFKGLILWTFLRTIFRARRAAKWQFFNRNFRYRYAIKTEFSEYKRWSERAAIWLLYQVYGSWSYRAIHLVCSNLAQEYRDFKESISKKRNEEKEKDGKRDKKDVLYMCEHGKTCEYKNICYRATPTQLYKEDRLCQRIGYMVRIVEYEPTTTCNTVRCAAVIEGKCFDTLCVHFNDHKPTTVCCRPERKDECPLHKKRPYSFAHIENYVHCVISDSSLEINLSFKRKKEYESGNDM